MRLGTPPGQPGQQVDPGKDGLTGVPALVLTPSNAFVLFILFQSGGGQRERGRESQADVRLARRPARGSMSPVLPLLRSVRSLRRGGLSSSSRLTRRRPRRSRLTERRSPGCCAMPPPQGDATASPGPGDAGGRSRAFLFPPENPPPGPVCASRSPAASAPGGCAPPSNRAGLRASEDAPGRPAGRGWDMNPGGAAAPGRADPANQSGGFPTHPEAFGDARRASSLSCIPRGAQFPKFLEKNSSNLRTNPTSTSRALRLRGEPHPGRHCESPTCGSLSLRWSRRRQPASGRCTWKPSPPPPPLRGLSRGPRRAGAGPRSPGLNWPHYSCPTPELEIKANNRTF